MYTLVSSNLLSLFGYFTLWVMALYPPNGLFSGQLQQLNYFPLFLLPLLGAYVCISGLGLNTNMPKLATLLKVNAYVALVLMPSALFLASYAHILVAFSLSLWVISSLFASYISWQNGVQAAPYLLMAFVCLLMAGGFILVANVALGPETSAEGDVGILLAAALHAILLILAFSKGEKLSNQKNIALHAELVTGLDLAEEELKQVKLKLEQSEQALVAAKQVKRQFLGKISDELRSPLSAIVTYAEGILSADIDKSEQTRVVKIIAENGEQLLTMLNDISELSQIDAESVHFESIPTELFSILAEVESMLGKQARDKGLALHLDYQYPLPSQIYTDPTRLKQILFSLSNNAVKFTELGYIGLSVRREQHSLLFTVTDSGLGMSPEQLTELFEPFSQVDNPANRRHGGIGISLSICQRLAKGLGGKIEVSSALRKGSTFSLSIDLKVLEDSPSISAISDILQSTPLASERLTGFSGCKILLAEGQANNRELIALMLKKMHIDVTEVSNGKQVLESIFYQRFDLLLLDIHLPGIDAIETLKRLRLSGNNTAIIALSTSTLPEAIEHYMRIGFSAHLAKPIDSKSLAAVLEKHLSTQAAKMEAPQENDMLDLSKRYQQELKQQLIKIKQAWADKDLTFLGHISEEICASANTFGFDRVGTEFADIEQYASQQDELALAKKMPNAMAIAELCVDLPGVDIPLAISQHKHSVETFLHYLSECLPDNIESLNELQLALEKGDKVRALTIFSKPYADAQTCGFRDSLLAYAELDNMLKEGQVKGANHVACLDLIRAHLNSVEQVLKQTNIGD